MYKRVLLKLSGEALSSPEAAFDPEILKRLAKELKEVQKLGVELAIVVGGGNFIRGKMMAEMGMNRAQADTSQQIQLQHYVHLKSMQMLS